MLYSLHTHFIYLIKVLKTSPQTILGPVSFLILNYIYNLSVVRLLWLTHFGLSACVIFLTYLLLLLVCKLYPLCLLTCLVPSVLLVCWSIDLGEVHLGIYFPNVEFLVDDELPNMMVSHSICFILAWYTRFWMSCIALCESQYKVGTGWSFLGRLWCGYILGLSFVKSIMKS